jgi:hypothetical protein
MMMTMISKMTTRFVMKTLRTLKAVPYLLFVRDRRNKASMGCLALGAEAEVLEECCCPPALD